MSEVLRDNELSNLKLLHEELRRLREMQLAPAELINSSFEVRMRVVNYSGISGPEQVVDVEPKRVYLLVAPVYPGDVYLWHPSFGEATNGISFGTYTPFTLSIRDAPGLVSEAWYLGTQNVTLTRYYVIEILDRRRR
jgi:hypothetical protein